MSQPDRVKGKSVRPDEAREERLRALLDAAYPKEYPSAEPSAAVEERVAGLAARSRTRALARHTADGRRHLRWTFAMGTSVAAALLLLAAAGLTRWERRAAPRPAAPTLTRRSVSPVDASPLRSARLPRLRQEPAWTRRLKPRATKAQSPPARTAHSVPGAARNERPWGLRVSLARDFSRRVPAGSLPATSGEFDFIQIPLPRVASTADASLAAALESHRREAETIDPRLTREVTLAFKATALTDLCAQLRQETGILLEAGASVADEKVTLFCRQRPLREVMRQLSRPFGYIWLRSGKAGEYRYELVQDLRSQLLEEELRHRDRNAALLAMDQEMQRYRPYLGLSPNEALAGAKRAAPEEKHLLENLARDGWGAIQIYYRLSPRDLAALRAGQELTFSADPRPGEQPLPADLAPGVVGSLRDWRIRVWDGQPAGIGMAEQIADGLPLAAVPEARVSVKLRLGVRELGQFALVGGAGVNVGGSTMVNVEKLAVGISPTVRRAGNKDANVALADDPALRPHVTVQPQPSCQGALRSSTPDAQRLTPNGSEPGVRRLPRAADDEPLSARRAGSPSGVQPSHVTSADVLEALHRATGLPIVADFYTRLYPVASVTVQDRTRFEALNQLADTMRLRWQKEGDWLQLRSTSYYDDRLKEVPDRLLSRWAASRRQHGTLPLEDLLEIGQLSEAQLDASEMAEGARECFGLVEWDLARSQWLRSHLRYLATLTPAQRQVAMTPDGLPFSRLSLSQQQQLISHLGSRIGSLEELSGAVVRAEYLQPGAFRWLVPEVVRPGDSNGRTATANRLRAGMFGFSPVQERTREAALQAARRIDASVDATQIVPTELALGVVYVLVEPKSGDLKVFGVRRFPPATRINW
jgi:hypothetical protein